MIVDLKSPAISLIIFFGIGMLCSYVLRIATLTCVSGNHIDIHILDRVPILIVELYVLANVIKKVI
jgi:hypothetical protein